MHPFATFGCEIEETRSVVWVIRLWNTCCKNFGVCFVRGLTLSALLVLVK